MGQIALLRDTSNIDEVVKNWSPTKKVVGRGLLTISLEDLQNSDDVMEFKKLEKDILKKIAHLKKLRQEK